jgi:hypothetical protein
VATETTVRLTDDLDGSIAAQTVAFAWDGTPYEIDLSKKNVAALGKALQPYIDAGRKLGSASRINGNARRSPKATATKPSLEAVRAWATEQGYEVAQRGRISAAILEAYESASA